MKQLSRARVAATRGAIGYAQRDAEPVIDAKDYTGKFRVQRPRLGKPQARGQWPRQNQIVNGLGRDVAAGKATEMLQATDKIYQSCHRLAP